MNKTLSIFVFVKEGVINIFDQKMAAFEYLIPRFGMLSLFLI